MEDETVSCGGPHAQGLEPEENGCDTNNPEPLQVQENGKISNSCPLVGESCFKTCITAPADWTIRLTEGKFNNTDVGINTGNCCDQSNMPTLPSVSRSLSECLLSQIQHRENCKLGDTDEANSTSLHIPESQAAVSNSTEVLVQENMGSDLGGSTLNIPMENILDNCSHCDKQRSMLGSVVVEENQNGQRARSTIDLQQNCGGDDSQQAANKPGTHGDWDALCSPDAKSASDKNDTVGESAFLDASEGVTAPGTESDVAAGKTAKTATVARSASSASDCSQTTSIGDEDEVDEELDPRLKGMLELLNQCVTNINRLENEIHEGEANFKKTKDLAIAALQQKARHKRCMERARPYFKAIEQANEAKAKMEIATRNFKTAQLYCEGHKESVRNVEELLNGTNSLDLAFQEHFNKVTQNLMEEEGKKAVFQEELTQWSAKYQELKQQISLYIKKYNRSIEKARPYFEEKASWDSQMELQKQNILDLRRSHQAERARYNETMQRLGELNEEIHKARGMKRLRKRMLQYPREPGVGAEMDSPLSSLSELNIEGSIGDDSDDDDWDESSNASDGVFSPKVSRHNSTRHSRESSFGSAKIKPIRRCVSGSACDFSAMNKPSPPRNDSANAFLPSPPGAAEATTLLHGVASRLSAHAEYAETKTGEVCTDRTRTLPPQSSPSNGLKSPEGERACGDGTSEEEVVVDNQPASQNCKEAVLQSQGSQEAQKPRSSMSTALATSAAVHLSSCTGVAPVLPPLPLSGFPQLAAGQGPSSCDNEGVVKTPLRRTDTFPNARKLKAGHLMLNPSSLSAMPTMPPTLPF